MTGRSPSHAPRGADPSFTTERRSLGVGEAPEACTGVVTPVHSAICGTTDDFRGSTEDLSEGDLRALGVDTLAVVADVGPEVVAALRARSGRRLMVGPDGRVEADQVRIGSIPGTYDPNLWVQVLEENELSSSRLKVEGSAHRHILGHNVHGAPRSIVGCARYLIRSAERWLGVELPSWELWRLTRVDLTEVYDCGSEEGAFEAYKGLSEGLRKSTALRSAPRDYGTTCYAGKGFKAYLKGAEVRRHRPLWTTPESHLQLVDRASSLVRLETEYRQREIGRLTQVRLEELNEKLLKEAARRRIANYTRLGDDGMKVVRTIEEVAARLQAVYTPQTAAVLLGTWLKLTTLGETATRQAYSARTFYRHIRQLKDASCSWQGTDVMRIECRSALPDGFAFSPRSAFALVGEDPAVSHALAYAAA